MSVKTIIEEAKKLSKEEKQQIAYYFLFSTLNEDKRNDLMQLFVHSFDFSKIEHKNNHLYKLSNEMKMQEELKQKENRKPIFGTMKGGIKYMAPDFDAPLEDFNDYM